jgi:Zn finger protein HypA/HybF involved in hydrogenase expression
MSEAVAQKKFECPACGAEAVWNPQSQALICPFCGTKSPATLVPERGGIQEHPLAPALFQNGERGWKAEKRSVKCQSCHAISVFDPNRVAQRCDFCGSSQIVPYEQIKPPIQPESLLPVKLSDAQVRDLLRQWYGNRWFAPNKLKRAAMTDTLHGLYLPYWTFDAQVNANWSAEAGHYYYTTESYRDSAGREQVRQVRHVRWTPASGHVSHFFDDQLVPASKGVFVEHLAKIEPFPTRELVRYEPGFVAGWVVEQYQIDLAAAAQNSRQRMNREIEAMCARQVPGDTYRNLQVWPQFSAETFKHVLLPVWLVHFHYGAKRYQVVVNAVTGAVAGKYPLSPVKIAFLILAIIIALLFLLYYQY